MDDSGTGKALGEGYDYASVSITGGGGSGAIARAILSQDSGLGADPRKDLRSFALMFNAKIDGSEGDTIQVGNDFRQTVLYKFIVTIYSDATWVDSGTFLEHMRAKSFHFSLDNSLQLCKFTSLQRFTRVEKDSVIVIGIPEVILIGITEYFFGEINCHLFYLLELDHDLNVFDLVFRSFNWRSVINIQDFACHWIDSWEAVCPCI